MRRLTSERTARVLALLIVALIVGLTIRHNTFAAWATDSGAYLSSGQAWARGDLFTPATFVFWAPWAAEGPVEFPYGHVQGPIKGTITGQDPLGYPLLIAAALKLTGSDLAPHLVSPLLAGMLVWCAFVLGRLMVTPWAGALAALLIGATPVVWSHSIIPFSDVPAVAFWALSWVMSVRSGYGAAAASGAAAAMATMIRPNLAPLAVVLAVTVAFAERSSLQQALKRLLIFGVVGALGPLLILWSQAELYGHPLQSGYRVPMEYFFQLERVSYNAGLYPRMLAELHTWVAFGGLLYVPFAVHGMHASGQSYTRGVVALSAVGLILVNYTLYLPYLTYVGWHWLRFLLPALLAMFVLLAAGVDQLRVWLAQRWPKAAPVAILPALFVAWAGEAHLRPGVGYERIHMTQRYLQDALPSNAVILTNTHGGAWTAASGRPSLRLDVLSGDNLDRVVADLQRRQWRPVFIFDAATEGDFFAYRYKAAELGRLTWPARAEVTTSTSVLVYDIRDREAFFSGDRWPTDVLLGGRTERGLTEWAHMRAPLERIILPFPQETAAFRSVLDAIYRDHLGRTAINPAIDPGDFLLWMRRYLRLRLHGCGHERAVAGVWQQLSTHRVPQLCARPDTVSFPPENESMDFRRHLEEWLRDRPVRQPPTYVDALGEVVWTQRYVEQRVRGCSHQDATTVVVQQITGENGGTCAPQ